MSLKSIARGLHRVRVAKEARTKVSAIVAATAAEQAAHERCMAEPLDSPELERLRADHIRALNALDDLTGSLT